MQNEMQQLEFYVGLMEGRGQANMPPHLLLPRPQGVGKISVRLFYSRYMYLPANKTDNICVTLAIFLSVFVFVGGYTPNENNDIWRLKRGAGEEKR
jgi:hypothetical protein